MPKLLDFSPKETAQKSLNHTSPFRNAASDDSSSAKKITSKSKLARKLSRRKPKSKSKSVNMLEVLGVGAASAAGASAAGASAIGGALSVGGSSSAGALQTPGIFQNEMLADRPIRFGRSSGPAGRGRGEPSDTTVAPLGKDAKQRMNALDTNPEFKEIISRIAAKHNVTREDIYAIIKGESNFNPSTRSPGGGYGGLFQMGKGTLYGKEAWGREYTSEEIRQLSPMEQAKLYEQLLDKHKEKGWQGGREGLPLIQAAPAALSKNIDPNQDLGSVFPKYGVGGEYWRANPGWRDPKTGIITPKSISDYYYSRNRVAPLPDGAGAAQQPVEPTPDGSGIVRERQKDQASTVRKGDLDPKLRKALDYAAQQSGLDVDVTSGGQRMHGAPGHVGSHRHDSGRAADFNLRDPKTGKVISPNDPRALEFYRYAARAGVIGGGEGYMKDPNKIHLDIDTNTSKPIYAGSDAFKNALKKGKKERAKLVEDGLPMPELVAPAPTPTAPAPAPAAAAAAPAAPAAPVPPAEPAAIPAPAATPAAAPAAVPPAAPDATPVPASPSSPAGGARAAAEDKLGEGQKPAEPNATPAPPPSVAPPTQQLQNQAVRENATPIETTPQSTPPTPPTQPPTNNPDVREDQSNQIFNNGSKNSLASTVAGYWKQGGEKIHI